MKTLRSEQVLVSKDSAHFNVTVLSLSKKQGKDILWRQAEGQRFPAAISLPNCCVTPPATQVSCKFLWAWRDGSQESLPTPRLGQELVCSLHALWKKDQESKPWAPVCLCEQQSCKPVPKHGWCLGLRKSAELSACLCSEQAGSHLTGASLCLPGRTGSHLPAHSSATSKGGSWLLGAMRLRLLCMLSSGWWFNPCQAGTAVLLTQGNPSRVESPFLGKEARKSDSEVAQLRARKMSGRAQVNEEKKT